MTVIVSETGEGKFTQKITIGEHVLTADEPVDAGGKDLGPGPYDFLLAGLGACTAMTIRWYADIKKIPLKHVKVSLTQEKIHSKDCENCDDNSKIDHIDRKIELEGDLSEEHRQKLLDIANKCPVHRTLTSTISITTELVK
jgi:putative redox protein